MKQRIFSLLIVAFILLLGSVMLTSCASGGFKESFAPEMGNDAINGEEEFMFGESYNEINENPFYDTSYQPDSYFTMDSFTASYSNLRRYINQQQALNGNIIKTDELINYFDYDIKRPTNGETFAVTSEMSTAPWNENNQVITIGVATEEAEYIEGKENNIVFLIDASGSMNSSNKLPLLKDAFKLLLKELNPTDRVSIVTYANGVDVKADGIQADNYLKLNRIISRITAGGGTNGAGGIQTAYELAEKYLVQDGINRVFLATDGDFNIGISDSNQLKELIQSKAQSGVYLSVLGFGMGNYQDTTVETLAKYGNGTYAYVDSLAEAKKVLVDDFNKTMITVAKDVKNKVAFNPNLVSEYRLIGYENKSITKEEFEDVNADAGDLGSGHETLVTYEVKLKDNYQTINEELFKLQINYKDPKTLNPKTFIYNGTKAELAEKDTEDHEFVKCIVEFSLILRNSPYRGTADYVGLVQRLAALKCIKDDNLKLEFFGLVSSAFQRNLVAHPAYQNDQQSNGCIVTIYTQFGSVQTRYNYNTFIDYNSIMRNVFGKVPTSTTFKMYLDPNYSSEFKEGLVVSDMDIYLIELK